MHAKSNESLIQAIEYHILFEILVCLSHQTLLSPMQQPNNKTINFEVDNAKNTKILDIHGSKAEAYYFCCLVQRNETSYAVKYIEQIY